MAHTLSTADVTTDHAAYAQRRPAERQQMIPVRRERKVRVGDILTFAFENAQTLAYQVQEMIYTERVSDPAEVAREVDLYRRMLPDSHSLVATMFIELTDPATIRTELSRLDGLQRGVSLLVGPPGQQDRIPAEEIPGPDEDPARPGALVSVHTFRFRLSDAARDAFRDPDVPVELAVEHPEYSAGAPIAGPTRMSLLADLTLQA